jgi:uncharacterized coiled-coil DUF342 family protein
MSDKTEELSKLEKHRSKLLAELKQARREMDKLRGDAVSLVLDGSDIGKLPEKIYRLETLDEAIVTAVKRLDGRISIAQELVLAEEREAAAAHAAELESQDAWRYR